MNFNVYLSKTTGEQITKKAKELHRSRNSIITEALEEWLGKHARSQWPVDFFDFEAADDVPDFKGLRDDLKQFVDKDPLE